MDGVGDAGQSCGDEPGGCKRILGIGAIDHQPKSWRCDGGLHVDWIATVDAECIEVRQISTCLGMRRKGGSRYEGDTKAAVAYC